MTAVDWDEQSITERTRICARTNVSSETIMGELFFPFKCNSRCRDQWIVGTVRWSELRGLELTRFACTLNSLWPSNFWHDLETFHVRTELFFLLE